MFQQLERLSPDSILGLMAKYRADPSDQKVDLGVGVYRDLSGNTPILDCVRRAEREVLAGPNHQVLCGCRRPRGIQHGGGGIGAGHQHIRAAGTGVRGPLQTPGGCGALRVGAELIKAAAPTAAVHLSDPTWGNHAPLLGTAG